jgi:hypothetical protein
LRFLVLALKISVERELVEAASSATPRAATVEVDLRDGGLPV